MTDQTTAQRLYAWGRCRFESQPSPVTWAGHVLRAASRTFEDFPEVDDALLLSETEERWPQAREVFHRLRLRSLDQNAPLNKQQALLFTLAELVTKVAYNAAGMRAPFDYDSGWRIGPVAYRLMSATDDPQLQAELTTALGELPEDI
ncbi:hypothetical protein [Actinoplanes subtropicus]|uniref:hypothetical protein n=1 Tax=Actinoplanes subtropicus TaxID=543632 RepID=UPI0004C2CDCF|nr:hypothetical protein [Actinoplanes subtropicus]